MTRVEDDANLVTVPDPQRQAIIDLLAAAMLTEEVTPWRARRNAAALVDGPLAPVIEALAIANEARSCEAGDADVWDHFDMHYDALDPVWLGEPWLNLAHDMATRARNAQAAIDQLLADDG